LGALLMQHLEELCGEAAQEAVMQQLIHQRLTQRLRLRRLGLALRQAAGAKGIPEWKEGDWCTPLVPIAGGTLAAAASSRHRPDFASS
jgi:hypothetical protein